MTSKSCSACGARAIALVASLVAASCGGTESSSTPSPTPTPTTTPTTGTISGTARLETGVSGDLGNARVAIYKDMADFNADRVLLSVATSGIGASVTYSMPNVTPGTYYLDVWKDVNNNLAWDRGDLWGIYGTGTYPSYTLTPVMVAAGYVTTVNMTVYVVP
jgi:hypothetical protein